MSDVRLRSTRLRLLAVAAAAGLLVVALVVGGGTLRSSAEPTVQAFLLDWANGKYRAAAAQTTGDPDVVAASLISTYRQLDADDLSLSLGPVSQRGDTALAYFNAKYDLGPGGAPWSYQGQFRLRAAAGGWKVVWSPAVIVPGLRPGQRLAVLSSMPPRAPLLDAAGRPLARLSPVYVIGVRPGKVTNPERTATALAAATGLDASQVLGEIEVAPAARFLKLVQLQPAVYQRIKGKLARVPGLIVTPVMLRLFDSIAGPVTGKVGTETARILQETGVPYRPGTTVGLSGLQQAFQRTLVGTPTIEVVTENAAGQVVSVLKRWLGHPGTPVRTTIDASVQDAANQAVTAARGSAAIVAVRPADGQILAVADHTAAGMPAVQPLAGRYQPGQVFTMVSTAALLTTGFGLDTPIPCKSSDPVGGQNFVNDPPEPRLGAQPPFRIDFAHACSTAFAGLSIRLSAADLMTAAQRFGLGARWQLPMSPLPFTGSMQLPGTDAELAADAIGTGTVRVSPLQAALMAAVVDTGTWHRPSLVTSPPDPGLAPETPFGAQVVQGLRTLMRATVAIGAGRGANVGRTVAGQVGSVPLGPGAKGLWASWFVGFRGNVAFAVLEFSRSPATSAAPLAGAFLRGFNASS